MGQKEGSYGKIYLSKITVVNREYTSQKIHSIVMSGFRLTGTSTPRKDLGVLYRVDKDIYVQSKEKPNWDHKYITDSATKEITHIVDSISIGDRYKFVINTHPYKKRHKKRVTLVDDLEKIQWIMRKASQNGFIINDITELDLESVRGIQGNYQIGYISTVISGELEVTDEKFKEAFINGIGPGKAYGLGMLQLY